MPAPPPPHLVYIQIAPAGRPGAGPVRALAARLLAACEALAAAAPGSVVPCLIDPAYAAPAAGYPERLAAGGVSGACRPYLEARGVTRLPAAVFAGGAGGAGGAGVALGAEAVCAGLRRAAAPAGGGGRRRPPAAEAEAAAAAHFRAAIAAGDEEDSDDDDLAKATSQAMARRDRGGKRKGHGQAPAAPARRPPADPLDFDDLPPPVNLTTVGLGDPSDVLSDYYREAMGGGGGGA